MIIHLFLSLYDLTLISYTNPTHVSQYPETFIIIFRNHNDLHVYPVMCFGFVMVRLCC